MWRAFLQQLAKILKILNYGRLFLSMVEPQPSPKLEDGSVIPDKPELLSFPTPREPLREWTEQNLDPAVMIAAIEAVMQIARSQPDFEAQRLARKTAVRFRY